MITHDRLKELVSYDKNTGKLFSKVKRGNIKENSELRGEKDGYQYIQIDGEKYYGHRLAWFYVYKEWPYIIDHINGNKLDNRIENLRNVSLVENARNAAVKKNTKSKYRGVSFSHGRWVAYIRFDGKLKYLGASNKEEHAAMLYDIASFKYHGNFGRRNFYPLV